MCQSVPTHKTLVGVQLKKLFDLKCESMHHPKVLMRRKAKNDQVDAQCHGIRISNEMT